MTKINLTSDEIEERRRVRNEKAKIRARVRKYGDPNIVLKRGRKKKVNDEKDIYISFYNRDYYADLYKRLYIHNKKAYDGIEELTPLQKELLIKDDIKRFMEELKKIEIREYSNTLNNF